MLFSNDLYVFMQALVRELFMCVSLTKRVRQSEAKFLKVELTQPDNVVRV